MRALLISLVVICLSYTASFANGYEVYPYPLSWSADSKLLAVVLPYEFSGSSTGGPLVVYDKAGRERLYLEGMVFSSPAFHPANRQLAVIADGALIIIDNLNGDGYETVVESGIMDCTWVEYGDSYSLMYSAGERFGAADIFIIEPDGNHYNITDFEGEAAATGVMTSPGDTFAVFTRMPGDDELYGYERLWAYDLVAGALFKACNEQAREWDYHESNPTFPFDDWVIFQRGGWGDWNLYRLDLKTGKEYLELPDAQQPSVSVGGQYLGFTRRDYKTKLHTEYDWEIAPSVWLMDRGKGVTMRVSPPGKVAQYPAVSPDGMRIAWLQEKNDGTYKVVIRGIPGLVKLVIPGP